MLLFDEADALFGKRSEVKDSHDRYANIEVELPAPAHGEYRGLAILRRTCARHWTRPSCARPTTSCISRFPDQAQRRGMAAHLPAADTPTRGLAWDRLAQLQLLRRPIRNVALNAAYLAAEAGEPISMADIAIAVRSEYAKQNRQISMSELVGVAVMNPHRIRIERLVLYGVGRPTPSALRRHWSRSSPRSSGGTARPMRPGWSSRCAAACADALGQSVARQLYTGSADEPISAWTTTPPRRRAHADRVGPSTASATAVTGA